MSHIGLLTPAYPGHVAPMVTLGRALQRRGHRVSVISTPDAEEAVLRGRLEFVAVGGREFPLGSMETFADKLAALDGLAATRFIVAELARHADAHARDLPDAVTGHGVTALVVDQVQPMGAAVAERFDLPFVSLCSLLPLNIDPAVPPCTTYWSFGDSAAARLRNAIGIRAQMLVEQPLIKTVNRHRDLWGLTPSGNEFSRLAQIAQVPAAFDFPRRQAPACLHHTGPIHDDDGDAASFPWERLDGRALVYAAMETLHQRDEKVVRILAEACAELDVQLVVTLGSKGTRIPANYPGNPVIVGEAPRRELIKHASLFVACGDMSALTRSLACGVPMVLIPASHDQPGLAARAKYHGVGEYVPRGRLTAGRLSTAMHIVLSNPLYRDKAAALAEAIKGVDAAARAAGIVEEAVRTRRPVLRA